MDFLPKGGDLKRVMDHYDQLGFMGAMGSTDVTHVHWGRATCSHSKLFTGKEGFPTLVYEATVDHTGRVMACTKGYPGSQNDKTIVRLDGADTTVRKEKPYIDIEFKLLSQDGTEDGKETSHVGVYLIVDGGYHLVSDRPRGHAYEYPQYWEVSIHVTANTHSCGVAGSPREDVGVHL